MPLRLQSASRSKTLNYPGRGHVQSHTCGPGPLRQSRPEDGLGLDRNLSSYNPDNIQSRVGINHHFVNKKLAYTVNIWNIQTCRFTHSNCNTGRTITRGHHLSTYRTNNTNGRLDNHSYIQVRLYSNYEWNLFIYL